ncbi:MAG TPA: sigma-70 family RNA polymerase sigma factor [Gemmatimonadaceae bacterium]
MTDAPSGEAWLVLRAQAGSREHLERLVDTAQRFLAPRLAPMFDQPADAEDVLQDVLFVICRRLWTLNDVRLFRPWAHRIAMRAAWKAIHRVRRERTRDANVDLDMLPGADRDETIDLVARLGAVSQASRVVLMLHYVDGMTIEATAAELGVAPGTVKSRLAYGLKQLRAATARSPDARR